MRYLSVCSGIEAATVAWRDLQWEAAGFAEIDAFPSAVLKHHYPEVKNFGDFTKIGPEDVGGFGAVDILVGGTPCQSFSVAGKRLGMDDPRGNLAIEFLRLAQRLGVRWILWENVPGVLSSNEGRDFGSLLGLLGECGFGWSYRVLDAQFFGVPQRRRRVFLVGYFGDWRSAAAVLFERESLSGNPAPSRKAGEDPALCVTARFGSGRNDPTAETYVAEAYQCHGTNVGPMGTLRAGNGNQTGGVPFVPVMAFCNSAGDTALSVDEHTAPPITTRHGDPGMVAFTHKDHGADAGDIAPTLRSLGAYDANDGSKLSIAVSSTVRRLTPRECERLQGFPDDYTLVPYRNKLAADGPRYKALGNSMAVPCMLWIGSRIQSVEILLQESESAA